MLDPKLKDAFINAMETGKFTHMKGSLADIRNNCRCALGVLAEEAGLPFHVEAGIPLVGGLSDKDGHYASYRPFYDLGLTEGEATQIFSINDQNGSYGRVIQHVRENL